MNETTISHEEIKAVVGDLPPRAAAEALANHIGTSVQDAFDILDGYYASEMWAYLASTRQECADDA